MKSKEVGVTVIVALIGLCGILGAAIIGNWDEIVGSDPNPVPATALPNITPPTITSPTITSPTITSPTITPTPKIYRDDHVGWVGEYRYDYKYRFLVDDFRSGRDYVLSVHGMIPVITSSCDETRGTIIVRDPFGRTILREWNNNSFLCKGGFRGWPDHPNDGLSQTQIDFVNRELKPYGREYVLDNITSFITGNGWYEVEWRWDSGCCGVYIWEMVLKPVP